MEQTWLETCFSAHPYNKGYIYTHIPPARSSRTNRLAKRTRICFQTWKDLGLLDLTNLGILPGEPKSYWVFSSRRAGTQRREDHKAVRGPFLGPPLCAGLRPAVLARAAKADPTRAFASSCIASRGARQRLFQAKGSFPVPVPPGSAPPQKIERGWSIPKSSPGALEPWGDIAAPRPGTAAPRPGFCQQSCRAPGH